MPRPVLLNLFEFDRPNYRVLTASNKLIWFSERDGWSHLYLYDLAGNLKNQITCGEWVVRNILYAGEFARQIYFTAGGADSTRDPYFRHMHRVSFDGTNLETLITEDAEHLLTASPSGNFFVDVYGLKQGSFFYNKNLRKTPLHSQRSFHFQHLSLSASHI